MPGRAIPFFNEQYYHVFNRGIDKRTTFTDKREYKRALQIIGYYRFASPPKKLSYYLLLSSEEKERLMNEMIMRNNKHVEIVAYCLMPNHFHFLLKQLIDGGISHFMANLQNSYTKYFNTKHDRTGPLFLNQFKAVRIESDDQLLHLSRYIHLNPATAYLVKDFEQLIEYPWSSISEYMKGEELCSTSIVINSFKRKDEYKLFLKNQVDYQRTLKLIEHLLQEA